MRRTVLIAFALLAAPLAAARAETAAEALRNAVLAPKASASSGIDAPHAVPALSKADAEAYALRVAGIAKTAVSQTSDDVTGELGFLCGLQPGQKPTGAAAIRGYDPNGRFVGAKFSIALK